MITPTADATVIAHSLTATAFPAYPEAQMGINHDRIHLGWDGLTPDDTETPYLACEDVTGDTEILDEVTDNQWPDNATLRWTVYDVETDVYIVSDLDHTATVEQVIAWAIPVITENIPAVLTA